MRILIVNSFYAPTEIGGAERSVRFLAEQLVAKGHEVMVFTTQNQEGPQHDVLNGVQVYRADSRHIEHFVKNFSDRLANRLHHVIDPYRPCSRSLIRDAVKKFKPDVAHTNNLSGLSVSVIDELHSLGIPIVHTLRDYNLLCANNSLRRGEQQCKPQRCLSCRVLSAPKKGSTDKVSVVVGNSDFILQKHLAYGLFQGAQTQTIYNGFSTDKSVEGKAHPFNSARPLRFGFIGMITPRKGIGLLIDAFSNFFKTEQNIELIIAGSPPPGEENFLSELASKTAGLPVKFLGQVTQEKFFSQIDCCVLPSLWDEPLSRVIFESFVFATPIISSTTGGSPELVKSGVTGILFDPEIGGDLEKAMKRIVDDTTLFEGLSAQSLKIASGFHPAIVVDRYFKAYTSALEFAATR